MRASTSYLGVEGTDQFGRDGVLFLDSAVRLGDIADGTTNTLMVGERPPSANGIPCWWYAGHGQPKDGSGDMVLGVRDRCVSMYCAGCPHGPHPGGANFPLADGSVRFLGHAGKPIMPALSARSGR